MKAAFLGAMRYLYPDGPANAHQQRDLIRCFSMGWYHALEETGQNTLAVRWLEENAWLKDFNWWPDESWKWW